MARKYIKGKDGKFAGSIPSETTRPNNLPPLPRMGHPKAEPTNFASLSNEQQPAARAWEKVHKLDSLQEEAKKVKKAYRAEPAFSQPRKQLKDKYKNISEDADSLRRELQSDCWRCYGTGKPMNSYGDTLEIFTRCPECNNRPLTKP